MLIINFSYSISDFNQAIDKYTPGELEKARIFDFAATLSKDSIYKVLYPSDIDSENERHEAALKNYVEEMGALSRVTLTGKRKDTIRDIAVKGLSVFWLTDISEKHPQNCVLKNVYYFKHLFTLITKAGESILLVLPPKGLHFQSAILDFLVKKDFAPAQISFNKPFQFNTSFKTYCHYLKNFHAKFKKARRSVPKASRRKESFEHLIATYFPQTWQGGATGDYVLGGIHRLCEEKKIPYKYLPLIFNYADFEKLQPEERFDPGFWKAVPGSVQVLGLFCKLLGAYRKVSNAAYDLSEITFVDKKALEYELFHVLHNKLEFFMNYTWLRNYFDTLDANCKVYYQDEFYPPGRLISRAAKLSKNEKIKTIGVQHGIFYEAHTVYSITDAEINKTAGEDGMPIPDHFVTWGKYFKELFLSNNSQKDEYIIDGGNLNYIDRVASARKPHVSTGNKTRFLWCTSLKVDVVNAYKNILKEFVSLNDDIEIMIRCHPQIDLKNFISNNLIESSTAHKYTFSSHQGILDAIEESDIVLTVSGSTVFLDALVANKPVFHLVNNDYYMGSLGKNEMKHVENVKGLSAAYLEYKTNKNNSIDSATLLTLSKEKWLNILETA